MTPAQTRDALVRKLQEKLKSEPVLQPQTHDQLVQRMNGLRRIAKEAVAALAALPVGDGEPVKYPDDIGVWRTAKELSARCDELAKRLVHAAPPPPAVPAGFVLVPVESSWEMRKAARAAGIFDPRVAEATWNAMLAARPDATAPAGEKGT